MAGQPEVGRGERGELHLGVEALTAAADLLEQNAKNDSRVQNTESGGAEDEAALRIDIDQQKAESLGVSVPAVNSMLATIFAGDEVNDFALGAQLRPVIVQARAENRMQPEDVNSWYARNSDGEMVPFSAFSSASSSASIARPANAGSARARPSVPGRSAPTATRCRARSPTTLELGVTLVGRPRILSAAA